MALSIGTDLQNALNSAERNAVVLITFFLGSETYGLWNLKGEGTYGGITYRGGASALDIGKVEYAADGSVAQYTLSLSTSPEKGLTADILQTFYDEDYRGQEVILQLGMRSLTTGSIVGVQTLAAGVIKSAPYVKGKKITLEIYSHAYLMGEANMQYRNSATQKAIDSTDTSLKDIGELSDGTIKALRWSQV